MNATAGVPFVALYALRIEFAYSALQVIQVLLQHFYCQTVKAYPVFKKANFLTVFIYKLFAQIKFFSNHPQLIQVFALLGGCGLKHLVHILYLLEVLFPQLLQLCPGLPFKAVQSMQQSQSIWQNSSHRLSRLYEGRLNSMSESYPYIKIINKKFHVKHFLSLLH